MSRSSRRTREKGSRRIRNLGLGMGKKGWFLECGSLKAWLIGSGVDILFLLLLMFQIWCLLVLGILALDSLGGIVVLLLLLLLLLLLRKRRLLILEILGLRYVEWD